MTPSVPLLVFTDLDGTLLDHDSYSYAAAQPALDALIRIGAPLVLASSKTAAEMAPLRAALGRQDCPAIVENGAGLLAAHAAPDPEAETYAGLRAGLAAVPPDLRSRFRGFGDMDAAEVAAITGLPAQDAALARTRAFSEPGLWDGDAASETDFIAALQDQGLHARRGGRFLTLSFGGTKADRMGEIIAQYRPGLTIALGDAPNDVEMLETADIGIVVANPHSRPLPLLRGENDGRIRRTEKNGPARVCLRVRQSSDAPRPDGLGPCPCAGGRGSLTQQDLTLGNRTAMTRLETYMQGVAEAATTERIWDAVLPFAHSFGIDKVSYHHKRAFGSSKDADTAVFARGFPTDWLCAYVDERLYEVDPIPAFAAHATQPFRWSEIGNLTQLKAPETAFLKRLMAEGLGDGLALQVFGPNMRNGYVGVGFATSNPDLSAGDIRELQAAAQVAHLRYCTLIPDTSPASLTRREAEVLTWIARGKSNSVIADILGVSPHTVDTLVRRIYGKLEVADRTTAAIHGIGAGLIQPSRRA